MLVERPQSVRGNTPLIHLTRVPRLPPPDWYDIHQYQSPAVSVNSSLYHLQEFDNHLDRIWRGSMVWRLRHRNGPLLLWIDGPQLGYRCVGRCPTCPPELWS